MYELKSICWQGLETSVMGYQSRRVGLSLFCQCLYILYSFNVGPGGNQDSDNHWASVTVNISTF